MPRKSSGDWLVMVDGAARGNPGPAGCGAFIRDAEGIVRKRLYRSLGITTNNVAEYEGLLMGLRAALEMGSKRVHVESDSELMVKQLNGLYRVRDEKLRRLYQEALDLLQRFESYCIRHVRREHNRVADRLANQGVEYGLVHEKNGSPASATKVKERT
jgi:ribonuclease HI